jgi:hypothetical protein
MKDINIYFAWLKTVGMPEENIPHRLTYLLILWEQVCSYSCTK